MISAASAASASVGGRTPWRPDQPLLEEGAHPLRRDSGGLGDVGPAHRGGVTRLRNRVLEANRHALRVEPPDDLLGTRDALALGSLACRRIAVVSTQ